MSNNTTPRANVYLTNKEATALISLISEPRKYDEMTNKEWRVFSTIQSKLKATTIK